MQRGKQVAADAAVHRVDDAFHESARDGGIDRVAAGHQDVGARLHGKRLRGDDHSGHKVVSRVDADLTGFGNPSGLDLSRREVGIVLHAQDERGEQP